MNWNIAKKLFLILIIIGIAPMIIFSFLTILGYQNLIEEQNKHLPQENQQIVQEIETNYKNIQIQTLLIFFLLAIFVIFFSIILVRKFIYPIKKLTLGTEEIKKGNLNTKIEINSNDEFAVLAESFNQMAFQLKNKIFQLEESKQSLKRAFSNLKKEREESETERNKVSTIIANFSDPIIMVDNLWKISLFNPSAEKVFNLQKKDQGRKINLADNRYFSFEDFKNIIKIPFESKIIEKRKNILVEEVVLPSEISVSDSPLGVGKLKYSQGDTIYKVTTVPVCDENNICLGYMKIFYDLTREKMVDELKSEFISIAAHQLRTPLTAIKWSMKMILNKDAGPLNEEQEDLLNQGYKSNERVIKLVNNMLNVSRIEEGRFGYSFGKHDINETIDLVVSNLKQEMGSKKIKFEFKKPKNIPKIYIDKEKIELVLQNLLENSVKFTPNRGKISLILNVSKENLIIKVKDNGVGIPKENQDKMFTKFFRAKNVMKMETEGTGLGLFIAKNIINKHNGTIEFESEEGKGTEFMVKLPLKIIE